MSELLRIGLVAEGPTDYEVIHAALNGILRTTAFTLTLLQPEATHPQAGSGWGGVLKWCHAVGQRHTGLLTQDPTLSLFDWLIIHLDADVATAAYADCGRPVELLAQHQQWRPLPCNQPCPPASDTCLALEHVLLSWLGNATADAKTILCIPAQSTGAWLASAVLDAGHPLLSTAECNIQLENGLASVRLPKTQRIKKTTVAYRQHAPSVTKQWEKVKQVCSQAALFEQQVLAQPISTGH
jgi:hypothetical protein